MDGEVQCQHVFSLTLKHMQASAILERPDADVAVHASTHANILRTTQSHGVDFVGVPVQTMNKHASADVPDANRGIV